MQLESLKFCILFSLLALALAIGGCGSSGEFTGFSYDPEGVTVTTDKEINPQHKRRIGVNDGSIWVSNEFPGARMIDFYQVNDSLYRVISAPENYPVNNSPWYSFKIWSDTTRSIKLQLSYNHGEHRYIPELSDDGAHWRHISPENFSEDSTAGTATLSLQIDKSPLWVSAQELVTMSSYQKWFDSLATKPYVTFDTVGYSHNQRPIVKTTIGGSNNSTNRGVMIIIGRQHPPEVTGAITAQAFIDELASDSGLAHEFRKEFEVWAYPLANPDGVEQGHWRHNGAGIDLNRDWKNFNQPETKAIRNDILRLKNDPNRRVFYGIDFHSTDENIFYPIEKEIPVFPEDFTYFWIDSLESKYPDFPMSVEPFDTSSPIAKNWIYNTFGADAVTYETNDRADRDSIKTVSRGSARIIMQELLNAKEKLSESKK